MRKALAILFVLGFGLAVWWLGLSQPGPSSSRQNDEVGVEMAGTWQSGIKVQNLNATTTTVSLQFLNQSGQNVGDAVTAALGPRASREFYLAELSIPDGRYSVVVRSDAPVAAVATQTNYGSGMADSYPASGGARMVTVPNLYRGLNEWYSTIFVQNTGNTVATVRLVAYRAGRRPLVLTASVPPKATKAFDTESAAFNPLGTGFRGAAKVSADGGQLLAVTVFHTRVSGSVHIMASPKGSEVTNPSTTLVLPSLYQQVDNWSSAIQLFNPSTIQTITATLVFRRNANWGQGGPWVKRGIVLPPRGSYEFSLAGGTLMTGSLSAEDEEDLSSAEAAREGQEESKATEEGLVEEASVLDAEKANAYLPQGFRGAAVVVATGPIQAQVMHTNYARDVGMSYQAPAQETLTSRLAFPSLYANFGQGPWNSTLKLHNRSGTAVTVNVTLKADDGVLNGQTWRRTGLQTPALSSVEFSLAGWPVDGGTLPSGFRGSAIVEATDPQIKLAGTATHTNYWRGVANIYTGISF